MNTIELVDNIQKITNEKQKTSDTHFSYIRITLFIGSNFPANEEKY